MRNTLIAAAFAATTACAPLDFSKLEERSEVYSINDNYEVVYSRLLNFHSQCKMMGWTVAPYILSGEGYARLTVGSAHEELYFYELYRVSDTLTNMKYAHGMVFGKAKVSAAQRATADGVMRCGDEVPESYIN